MIKQKVIVIGSVSNRSSVVAALVGALDKDMDVDVDVCEPVQKQTTLSIMIRPTSIDVPYICKPAQSFGKRGKKGKSKKSWQY